MAVYGTLHASDGGPALVQYSGHIKGLFAEDADLEIELQSKMDTWALTQNWVVATQIYFIFTPKIGEMIQFD